MKEALKSRDDLRISVVRMLLSDIHNQEIEVKGVLADEQIMKVLSGSAKKHQDSIAQFESGGRTDLVEKEKAELAIITSYLPEPLPDEELKKLVQETIAETKPQGPQDFGKVMQAVMAKAKGRAAGQLVSQIVKEELK